MTVYTKADAIINTIIEWFEENQEVFTDCIEELDNYNGYLGDERYYDMYDLEEFVNGGNVIDWLNRAYFGHDENNADSSFCPNRDYFRFNGYGNLISSDWKDYSDMLDVWAVKDMNDNRQYIDTIEQYSELAKMFDSLEEAEVEA